MHYYTMKKCKILHQKLLGTPQQQIMFIFDWINSENTLNTNKFWSSNQIKFSKCLTFCSNVVNFHVYSYVNNMILICCCWHTNSRLFFHTNIFANYYATQNYSFSVSIGNLVVKNTIKQKHITHFVLRFTENLT